MDGPDLNQKVVLVGQKGLKIPRVFTKDGENVFDTVTWEKRVSLIKNPDGTVVFKMDNVEVPNFWSQTAVDILAQKYFRKRGVPQFDADGQPILDGNGNQVLGSETSLRQTAHRLAGCWTWWGKKYNYFATEEDAKAFYDEIAYTIIHQFTAPNSPQWFNTGLNFAYGITGPSQGHWYVDPDTKELTQSNDAYTHPQCHACADYHTLVYTEKGAKYIGEIVEQEQTGLHIFDGENFVKISAVKNNGKKRIYRIKLSNGNYIELTEDHVVTSSEKRLKEGGIYKWLEVKDLKVGMRLKQVVGPVAVSDFMVDEKDLAEARLAGWVTGDGSVGIYDNVMRMEIISINKEEHDSILKDIKTVFGEDAYFWVTEFETDDSTLEGRRIHLTGKKIHSFVEKYQLMKRSRTVEVPKEILHSSVEIITEFLKTLFQADGCVRMRGSNSGDIVLSTVSEKLAFQVLQLLNMLGIFSRISIEKDKRENRANVNQISIAYGNARRGFQQLIGFIDSKKVQKLSLMNELITNSKNAYSVREETIEEIQELDVRDVYDIQTESGKFLANGVVVHNCFIQPVKDDLVNEGGIMDLAVREARIFKYGSGTGTNFSTLRGKGEPLSGGGTSSGVMSWLKIYDQVGGAIKSGGTTRRAAKMVLLNADHPEIEEFIRWKANEEKKFEALVHAGLVNAYSVESASEHVFGQNSNNSVRVSDDFMRGVIDGKDWSLTWRSDGRVVKTVKARHLWDMIAQAAWECADPGLQFDTTYNDWHTCPASGRINATNPCSEYAFLDNTACNLASLNLGKFVENGTFNVEAFKHASRLWTIVLEISVLMAQYPSKEIAQLSYEYRTLGLGYTNLGSVLMRWGIPYDSDKARVIAAAITAVMTGESYATSAEMASVLGSFTGFEKNREHMLRIIRNHRRIVYNAPKHEYEKLNVVPPGIDHTECPDYLLKAAIESWDRALLLGEQHGYRNAQSTLIAPTGTISFVMDADTTGIEPDFALVKFKKLVGGGYFKIVNQTVKPALKYLGYTEQQIDDIVKYMVGRNKLDGAPYINRFTLNKKGFTDEELDRLEKLLPSAMDLSFVFNVGNVGKDTLERMGIKKSQYTSQGFNLLKELGFRNDEIEAATEFICGTQTIEGAPHLKQEHYANFDCANKCGRKGERYIDYMAHVKMMGSTQPLLSGSISKTINMPNEATVEDIERVYFESWKLGIKSLALYRDGSKVIQPLNIMRDKKEEMQPSRRKLPKERQAIAHKFRIGNHEGYLHVGLFEDGSPGEMFITMSKQGSTLAGLMDAFALAISISLQYGVPLKVWVSKFMNSRFEPMGWTDSADIPVAKSIIDYIFRWMAYKFLPKEDMKELGLLNGEAIVVEREKVEELDNEKNIAKLSKFTEEKVNYDLTSDAPTCAECGSMMLRSGSCYVCTSCGSTSGCS